MAKPKKSGGLWLKKSEAALLLGCSIPTLDRQIRVLLEPSRQRGARETLRINAPALVKAWTEYRLDQAAKTESAKSREPIPDPGLAEQRHLENQMRRIKIGQLNGQLVDIDQMRSSLVPGFGAFKKTIAIIGARHGNDALDLVNHAVEALIKSIRRSIEAQEKNEIQRIGHAAARELDGFGTDNGQAEADARVRRAGTHRSKRS